MNITVTVNGQPQPVTSGNLTWPPVVCPDLLTLDRIGAADGLRGRLVRGFFWLLRAWPP